MPQNLFSRLIKYRSTEFKTNRENFLTESFAAVLENDDYFARLLIQKAVKALNLEHVICDDSLRYSVETQVRLSTGKRPDMKITLQKFQKRFMKRFILRINGMTLKEKDNYQTI